MAPRPIAPPRARSRRRLLWAAPLVVALTLLVWLLARGGNSPTPTPTPPPVPDRRPEIRRSLDAFRTGLAPSPPPAASAPRYRAEPGRVLRYTANLSHAVTLRFSAEAAGQFRAAAAERTIRLFLDGTLEVAAYAGPTPGALLLGFRFAELAISSDQAADPAAAADLAREMSHEALVVLTDRGQIEEIHFPREAGPHARNFLKAVILLTQIVLPAEPAPEWETTEEDTTGQYRAHYAATFGRAGDGAAFAEIAKRKLFYERIYSGGLGPKGLSESAYAVPDGGLSAVLNADRGFLRSVQSQESLEIRGEGFVHEVRVETDGVLLLLSETRDEAKARIPADEMAGALAALDASGPGRGESLQELSRRGREERWRALAQGQTVEGVLANLAALAQAGPLDSPEAQLAFRRLTALFGLDPRNIEEALARFRTEGHPMEVANFAMGCLLDAGTPAAQEAIAEILAERHYHPQLRATLLVGLYALPDPATRVEEVVRAYVDAVEDPGLVSTAILATGTLAYNLAETQADRSGDLVAFLLSREERLAGEGLATTFLGALGNAGDPAGLHAVSRYLGDADADVRVAAVSALRRMPAGEADRRLVAAVGDATPAVRAKAIQAMTYRAETPEIRRVAQTALLGDPERIVRESALRYFSTRADRDPSVREVLRQASVSDPDPQIRRAAEQALGGR